MSVLTEPPRGQSAPAAPPASAEDQHPGAPRLRSREDQATQLRELVSVLRARRDDKTAADAAPGRTPTPSARRAPGAHPRRLTDDSAHTLAGPDPLLPGDVPAAPPGPRPHVITVASGKGGVGKTFLAVNLSIALARTGASVVLLDADIGAANADVMCGVSPGRRWDPTTGRTPPVLDTPFGFRLVPGAVGAAAMAHGGDARAKLGLAVRAATSEADVVVIDTAAGVGAGPRAFAGIADQVLIVTTPDPTSVADAYATIKACVLGPRSFRLASHTGRSAPRPPGPRAAADDAPLPAGSLAPRVPGHASPQPTPVLKLVVNNAPTEEQASTTEARLRLVASRFLGLSLSAVPHVLSDPAIADSVRTSSPLLSRADATGKRPIAPAATLLSLARELWTPAGAF